MLAFRRFMSRRSMPRKVLSDNAKTFQAAAKEIRQHCVEESVKWIFNTPSSKASVTRRLLGKISAFGQAILGEEYLESPFHTNGTSDKRLK